MNAPVDYGDVKRARFLRILHSQGDGYLCTASQVSDYELCPRKWYFKYVEGRETPEKESTRFGTAVHEHLELWLRHGVVPPDDAEGRCAHRILQHLPHPSEVKPHQVEPEVDVRIGGVLFTVQMDLFLDDWQPPFLLDHKTTGDEVWSKKADPEHANALIKDVQFTLYAAVALMKSEAPALRAQWTYGLRRGSSAWPVSLTVRGRDIQPRLEKTIQSAREMRMLKSSGLRALDVVYDAQGCEAFAGCHFRDVCNLTPQERMESIMSDGAQRNLFLQQVAQKQGMAAPNGAAQASAPQQQLVNPLLGGFQQQQAPQQQQPAQTAPTQAPELPKRSGGKKATQAVAGSPSPHVVSSAPSTSLPPELLKSIADANAAVVFRSQSLPSQRWSAFAAAATKAIYPVVVDTASANVVLAQPGAVAELAAQLADALQAEHAKRFPNS